MIAVWLVLALLLVAGEALTLAFVALYFGVGAIAAALTAAAGANVVVQVLVFAAVSALSLVSTRGLLRRWLQRTPLVQSNAQTIVGERGVVTVPIDALGGRGQIKIGTEYWSARADGDEPIAAGARVEVVALTGVTAVVRPASA